MAYSDYGGYAYKNGQRVVERSDAVLSPEGIKATPGSWPGWTLPEGRGGNSYHVLLGDGPIFVGLYKQSTLCVHRLNEEIDLLTLLKDRVPEAVGSYDGKDYLKTDYFRDNDKTCVLEIDGCTIEIRWTYEDNYYQYVRLTQPDGAVWHGWSGYGVGAGLEDAGYGYSTEDREIQLWYLFPMAHKRS